MYHSTKTLIITIVITSMLLGFGSSDLAQDREECTSQLVAVSPCLPYVGGNAKAPTKDCCGGFGQVITKSVKCVCILIKDKDDPNLGLKFNATLAARLPTACHITAPNITECICKSLISFLKFKLFDTFKVFMDLVLVGIYVCFSLLLFLFFYLILEIHTR